LSLLATPDDAEQVAKAWMQRRYDKRLGRVKFVEAMNENGVWSVKAEVKLAVGVLLAKPHVIQVRIDSRTTDIVGYSEFEVKDKAD
jgi:hypothetical protein